VVVVPAEVERSAPAVGAGVGPGVCPSLRYGFPAVLRAGRPANNSPSNRHRVFCHRQARSSNRFAGPRCARQPSSPSAPRLLSRAAARPHRRGSSTSTAAFGEVPPRKSLQQARWCSTTKTPHAGGRARWFLPKRGGRLAARESSRGAEGLEGCAAQRRPANLFELRAWRRQERAVPVRGRVICWPSSPEHRREPAAKRRANARADSRPPRFGQRSEG
jgi:hypothetical protein